MKMGIHDRASARSGRRCRRRYNEGGGHDGHQRPLSRSSRRHPHQKLSPRGRLSNHSYPSPAPHQQDHFPLHGPLQNLRNMDSKCTDSEHEVLHPINSQTPPPLCRHLRAGWPSPNSSQSRFSRRNKFLHS